ncbi:Hypothetical_protein [Hexamita inflata]|uniref:Hypothetical_protein n=1 Tax=Hexamita inflata TaxID=28002 RepID=A0AA86TZA7_9EUKA|nr:Hypothetical protein HINF_LOCUS2813 [Hexamita inflata]CAI9935665.1 Hypothetical protein HINF_LOCUS23310 [Hexamita inflata]
MKQRTHAGTQQHCLLLLQERKRTLRFQLQKEVRSINFLALLTKISSVRTLYVVISMQATSSIELNRKLMKFSKRLKKIVLIIMEDAIVGWVHLVKLLLLVGLTSFEQLIYF